MGQARQKRERFLGDHPLCCFCGGVAPAQTIDHVPNRACFSSNVAPEDFEFPACLACQNYLRQEEQFFAFMCHLSDRNRDNHDSVISRRLTTGIKNNMPHLFPSIIQGANRKRRGLRHMGLEMPAGQTLGDLPMVELPLEIDPALRKVAVKIGQALYYRHKGHPAPPDHAAATYWAQAVDRVSMKRFGQVVQDLPNFEIGKRRNFEFGDRFSYAWSAEEDGEPDMFVAVAKFGQGLVICMLLADRSVWVDDNDQRGWIRVSDFWGGRIPASWENLAASEASSPSASVESDALREAPTPPTP